MSESRHTEPFTHTPLSPQSPSDDDTLLTTTSSEQGPVTPLPPVEAQPPPVTPLPLPVADEEAEKPENKEEDHVQHEDKEEATQDERGEEGQDEEEPGIQNKEAPPEQNEEIEEAVAQKGDVEETISQSEVTVPVKQDEQKEEEIAQAEDKTEIVIQMGDTGDKEEPAIQNEDAEEILSQSDITQLVNQNEQEEAIIAQTEDVVEVITQVEGKTETITQKEGAGDKEEQTTRQDATPVVEQADTLSSAPADSEKTEPLSTPASVKVDPSRRKRRISLRTKIIIFALIIVILAPTTFAIIEGINTYNIYTQARHALDRLDTLQDILLEKDPNTGSTAIFSLDKLDRAEQAANVAHADFQRLNDRLYNDNLLELLGGVLPQQLVTARSLVVLAIEALEIVQQGITSAQVVTPTLPDPTLEDETKPLVNPTMLSEARSLITFALPRIQHIMQTSQNLDLDSLPLDESQRKTIEGALALLPDVVDEMTMAQDFLADNVLDWLIGLDEPRNFLVQTVDRAELRATGGFTGQFGILTLDAGRMTPPQLENIGLYEKTIANSTDTHPIYDDYVKDNEPPENYDWWPIPNFGVRDSNVSADFPTTARLTLDMFNDYYEDYFEQADGLVVFTPFLIAQVLRITGPITIEEYDETVTADNLEEKLHYYQLDNEGIRRAKEIENVDVDEEARKLFTGRVADKLMERMKSLDFEMIVSLIPTMFQAMKTRDLQVYFTNPEVQETIAKYGSDASIDRSTDKDGLFIVQSNVSVSKASQYVRTYVRDSVTLDDKGGATHVMTMTLAYTQVGPVYGLDTYYDYIRVYVPPTSQFLWGKGFAQIPEVPDGQCGYGTQKTCKPDIFGDGTQICPPDSDSNLFPLLRAYTADGYLGNPIGMDKIGPPTNMQSDEPGRAMFGGWVEVLKNCTMTVSLSWYVPDVATEEPYQLLFQRQAGTFPIVDLTILPTPGSCASLNTTGTYYHNVLAGEDLLLEPQPLQPDTLKEDCYPQMRI